MSGDFLFYWTNSVQNFFNFISIPKFFFKNESNFFKCWCPLNSFSFFDFSICGHTNNSSEIFYIYHIYFIYIFVVFIDKKIKISFLYCQVFLASVPYRLIVSAPYLPYFTNLFDCEKVDVNEQLLSINLSVTIIINLTFSLYTFFVVLQIFFHFFSLFFTFFHFFSWQYYI